MCLQWLSWLRYHNESDFICYFERFCMFSKGVSWGWNLDSRGVWGGRTKKIFQARYRSPWPPLQHTFNFYPGSKVKVISSHRLYVSSLPLLNSGKMLYLCQLEAGGPAGAYCSEPGGHAHFLLLTKFINAIVVCKLLLACGHVQYD